MRKYINILLPTVFLLFGCNDFLDTESYTKKNTDNFPQTQEDAQQITSAIYSCLKTQIGYPRTSHFFVADMVSGNT